MQNQPDGPGDQLSMRQTFNLLGFAAVCYANCIIPFLRRRFGAEAFGFQGMFAFVGLLLLAGGDPTGVGMCYLWIWIAFVLMHRAGTMNNERKGIFLHSQYAGDPWIAKLVCRDDDFARRYVEPFLCLTVGTLLCPLSETVGAFVIFGAIALGMVEVIQGQVSRVRLQKMRDAEIEMQYYAERFRRR